MNNGNEKMKSIGIPVAVLLVGMVLAAVFTFSFTEIAEGIAESEVKAFDSAVIDFLKGIESATLDQIMFYITEMGSVWFISLISVGMLLYLWFAKKDKPGILFFIIAVGGGGLLTQILKYYYQRGRPSINPEIDAVGFSFPSGHSLGSLIFYGFLIYLLAKSQQPKTVKNIFGVTGVVIILLIGISRIYLGAHFPSDVVAGFLGGAMWLMLSLLALEWVKWRSTNHLQPIRSVRKMFVKIFN